MAIIKREIRDSEIQYYNYYYNYSIGDTGTLVL